MTATSAKALVIAAREMRYADIAMRPTLAAVVAALTSTPNAIAHRNEATNPNSRRKVLMPRSLLPG